jgi:transposase
MEKNVFIGIDVSKSKLDVTFILNGNLEKAGYFQVRNNKKGFQELLQRMTGINQEKSLWLFCFENTGVYSVSLACFLSEQNVDFCHESALRIKRSLGIKRGKNDKLDSKEIAEYAYIHREKLKLTTNIRQELQELKVLISYRERLMKQKNALLVAAKEAYECFENETTKFILDDSEELIPQYEKKIKNVERKMLKLIEKDEKLNNNFKLATSVVGISLIVGSYMLVQTNNFTQFNQRQYACHAGVAPYENSSGTDVPQQKRTSKMADGKIKALLTNAALNAKTFDPQLKLYYHRKIKEGKNKFCVLNAIRFKLISRVFASVKRGTPYVRMAH